MTFNHAVFFLALSISNCDGYLSQRILQSSRSRFQLNQFSNGDAAFSAFAESLAEEPPVKVEKPWQAKLEEVLDPKTNQADRQILLSELLTSNEAIRESVMDALANRKIDPLLTPTGKKLQDGTRAVVRQLANDILPQLGKAPPNLFPSSPESVQKAGARFFDIVTSQIQKNMEEFQQDLSDPINRIPKRLSKQTEELAQEARNVFLETPEGLQETPYTVVETKDLYEIRDYEGYTVASTVMGANEDMATTGNAFNTLASYLFGGNKENKSMAMTTPVTTTSLGEMRFYLAERNIPEPLDVSSSSSPSSKDPVEIIEIPAARLAVRKFTGFVTDGEIARQKETLLQALELDGVELDVAHGVIVPHVIFQYNPPYTLPILRRNEIAIPVTRPEEQVEIIDLKQEWNVEFDETVSTLAGDDVSPSDY